MGVGFYSIFPSESYMKSSFSVFYFKAHVHEVSIRYLPPADSAATFDQQQWEKGPFFLFSFSATYLLCLCVCAQKCTSVRPCVSVSVSESKWWGWWVTKALGHGSLKMTRLGDPCLTFTCRPFKKHFLFPFVLFVTQCLSPCISSFEISARSFSNNLKTCFPVSAALFQSMFGIERQSRHTLLYCASQILRFLQVESKTLHQQKVRTLFISIPTLWRCCGT